MAAWCKIILKCILPAGCVERGQQARTGVRSVYDPSRSPNVSDAF